MESEPVGPPESDPNETPTQDPEEDMAISAEMVRELREKSGAAMMDCKKALDASGGNMDDAFDYLRKSGLKAAGKKAGRETSEGRVAANISADGRSGAIVAVRCETDFVAKTPDFEAMMDEYSAVALNQDLPDKDVVTAFGSMQVSTGETVTEHLQQVIGKLGENIQLAGVTSFTNNAGYVAAYVHHNGMIGALASVTTSADRAKAEECIKLLCQHICAFRPTYARRGDVPTEELERERAVHMESEELAKKPEQIREKIVAGKLDKFYSEVCLVEQPWIKDDKQSVEKAIEALLGKGSRIENFQLFAI